MNHGYKFDIGNAIDRKIRENRRKQRERLEKRLNAIQSTLESKRRWIPIVERLLNISK